ncbi:MAG: PIG-L deacetylase family protein [Ilumatobacteraceae bacterium]
MVPHPDDEAVMFGGLLARLARRGTDVRVLAVTDGGAAYPDTVPRETLERTRRREQSAAMSALGLPPDSATRLGLPDGEVAHHEQQVIEAVLDLLGPRRVGSVVAPWEFDHHTDHEACGRAALFAAKRASVPCSVAGGLFWSLLRSRPPSGIRLSSIDLTEAERTAKALAIGCHRSQVGSTVTDRPVLTGRELRGGRLVFGALRGSRRGGLR